MARRSGVQLRVTDWILDGTDKDSGLAYGRLRMQMEGSLRNLVLARAARGHATMPCSVT